MSGINCLHHFINNYILYPWLPIFYSLRKGYKKLSTTKLIEHKKIINF